jgi:TonB family protein
MKTLRLGLPILASVLALRPQLAAQPPGPQDSALKIHQTVAPFYPARLFMEGVVDGEVRVAIEVDASGRLADTLVVAYTDFSLVRPTMDALRQWTFDPAVVNGEARSTTSGLVFDFRPEGPVLVQRAGGPDGDALLDEVSGRSSRKFQYEVRTLRDLDRIPAPLRIVRPVLPARADRSQPAARVTVDFYIDETGRVRLPAVSRSEDNELAWAAVQAVAQWTFVPPTVNGVPVTVLASQRFVSKP